MSTKEKNELALAAMGGPKHRPEACMCDCDVGACPCHYCAELDGLNEALKVVEENAELRAQVEKLERTDLTRIAENYALRADAEKGWAEVTSLHAALRDIIAKSDSPVVLATARTALKATAHDPR